MERSIPAHRVMERRKNGVVGIAPGTGGFDHTAPEAGDTQNALAATPAGL